MWRRKRVEDARVAKERVSMTCVVLGPETD